MLLLTSVFCAVVVLTISLLLPDPPADPPLHAEEAEQLAAARGIVDAFVAEMASDGGPDPTRSLWQGPGRGFAAGIFPRGIDVRYLRFLAEDLYRLARLTGEGHYHEAANASVRFMVGCMRDTQPSWAWGNALEMIGLYHAYNPADAALASDAARLICYLRQRRVPVTIPGGITYSHFPCGYGLPDAQDAGWTNDLSMVGSGLVWAYEVTGDRSILDDAVSFAEYFVQPWRADAVGAAGYWECGTWREDLGSWVIGPAHYSGFESTDVYGDETSWVFSTMTCTDYLLRLHQHYPDPRYPSCCLQATGWTFRACQFDNGAVGMCGRDDEWLGHTGNALSQVAMLGAVLGPRERSPFSGPAGRARAYLNRELVQANLRDHGVRWVTERSSIDPLVNVGMLWASAVLGWLNGRCLPR